MTAAVEVDRVAKRYRRTWALRDCTLTIPAGQVVALAGPNGAGKTTLLRVLAGLAAPSQGQVRVLGGFPPGSAGARDVVSYVDQLMPVYRTLRVRDVLGAAQALNTTWDHDLALARLAALGISLGRGAGKLSSGQQAQLALTLALARRPKLLLLDEPLASLDPLARHDVLGWLMTCVAQDGLSVLFSSHVVAELEQVANYLVVLSAGQVQVAGSVDDLLDTHQALIGPADLADSLAAQIPVVTMARAGRQAHAIVRGTAAPPGWSGRPVTMEDLVLAYLKEPRARAVPGLAVIR